MSDVWLSWSADGAVVYLCALQFNASLVPSQGSAQSVVSVVRSTDKGATWQTPPVAVASTPDYLNEPTGLYPSDDKNTVTADPNHARLAYAVWDRFPTRALAHSDTVLSRTEDSGQTWSTPPQLVYDPFPDLTAAGLSNGIFNDCQTIDNVIVVLPLRDKKHRSDEPARPGGGWLCNFMVRIYAAPDATDQQYLDDVFPFRFTRFDMAVVRSRDLGRSWEAKASVVQSLAMDPRVFTGGYTYAEDGAVTGGAGTLLRTGDTLPTFAADPRTGRLYAAFQTTQFRAQDRLPQVGLTWSDDAGLTWTPAVRASQTPVDAPNPQAFTPFVAVAESGLVGVLYFDFRNDTKQDDQRTLTDAWLVVFDGGRGAAATTAPRLVGEVRLSSTSYVAQNGPTTTQGVMTNGDYASLAAHGDVFSAVWTRSLDGPFRPPVLFLNDPVNAAQVLLDCNCRQVTVISVVKALRRRLHPLKTTTLRCGDTARPADCRCAGTLVVMSAASSTATGPSTSSFRAESQPRRRF